MLSIPILSEPDHNVYMCTEMYLPTIYSNLLYDIYLQIDEILGALRPLTAPRNISKRFVPVYLGEDNAFSIQLFCIDERYEMR